MKNETMKWNPYIGLVLIIIPILIQIPYTLLIMNFQYPDILRQPTDLILSEFQKGGSSLVWTWWFFGISGLPLSFAFIHLYQNTKENSPLFSLTAVIFGVASLFFQLIGLLRWVFVVPILSNLYIDPQSSEIMKQAVLINFQTIHHLFGVLIGEHLGQLFTILWMFLVSIVFRKNQIFPNWISHFGMISAFLYLLAQFELFSLVIPEVKEIPFAGLVGSLCWLVWMMALGIQMLKRKSSVIT
ncbi:DUF4386 domain-containing protein [Leptospira levettii]|uniref:DUF4386 domain-containing protein n=1 Tax=Leptospira levettii TaxID=2023178 RepID=A0ABY2MTT4_9LEPT|nr:DUF4386 domain-containing protein [Leptospira levettii]PKA27451.1 permease [Leptospira sp. mixed culture ATI2-C-A1]TGL75239.1 DUF4386 domain-containing protein [Leptospira levettii]TGM31393.1 DUF4386 domain-containing protein [Leptospira levettii]